MIISPTSSDRYHINSDKCPLSHFYMEKVAKCDRDWLLASKHLVFANICLESVIFRTCELQCPQGPLLDSI